MTFPYVFSVIIFMIMTEIKMCPSVSSKAHK